MQDDLVNSVKHFAENAKGNRTKGECIHYIETKFKLFSFWKISLRKFEIIAFVSRN